MQSPSADKPEEQSEKLDVASDGPSNTSLQQQLDLSQSADMRSIDKNLFILMTPCPFHLIFRHSTRSLLGTRPQSSGNADTSSIQDPLIKATSTPEVTGPDPIAAAGADLTANLDLTAVLPMTS